MEVTEFRSKIKPNMKLSADGQDFMVKEVVKFKFDDGGFYTKCFLSDGYVFADDLNENTFLLVKETKTPLHQPFPPELDFEGKNSSFFILLTRPPKKYKEKKFSKKETAKGFGTTRRKTAVT